MNIPGLSVMAKRIAAMGGQPQQDRMIKDKKLTFERALKYSYQAAQVRKNDNDNYAPALINPNKLKQDYDDKIISIDFAYDFQVGDVFEWKNTGTYWVIYLQELTELAYFRANIRKCSYETEWIDQEGNRKKTYMALRGPVETKINSSQKHGISIDTPNASLSLLVPKNKDTLEKFQRYGKFYLPVADDPYSKTCWRIEAIDAFSTPGIIEVVAVEYYSNQTTDNVEEGIVDEFVAKPIDPTPDSLIAGETFIKPQFEYTYTYTGDNEGDWSVDSQLPVLLDVKDSKTVNIKWDASYSGQFDLSYGDVKKTIVVESLF